MATNPLRGLQPGRPLRRRRPALLLRVPRQYDGFYGALIHDPLAVAAALDRALVETEALYVDVETSGELTTGMTLADRRGLTGRPANLDVATSADIATFLDRLVERVGGLAADRANVAR